MVCRWYFWEQLKATKDFWSKMSVLDRCMRWFSKQKNTRAYQGLWSMHQHRKKVLERQLKGISRPWEVLGVLLSLPEVTFWCLCGSCSCYSPVCWQNWGMEENKALLETGTERELDCIFLACVNTDNIHCTKYKLWYFFSDSAMKINGRF